MPQQMFPFHLILKALFFTLSSYVLFGHQMPSPTLIVITAAIFPFTVGEMEAEKQIRRKQTKFQIGVMQEGRPASAKKWELS
jgi:hypothetical protein